MYKMWTWGLVARKTGMDGSRSHIPENEQRLLDGVLAAGELPWLRGWRVSGLDSVRTEIIPEGPNHSYAPQVLAGRGAHGLNLVALGKPHRPALYLHTFADVYLIADIARFCVFRAGEVLGGSSALIADKRIARILKKPDFRIDEGAFCGDRNSFSTSFS